MSKNAYLYFHCPCFDGIISGVIAWDFLESAQSWMIERFCPVDYSSRKKWLTTRIHRPSAVVDFLYHPQAEFWADHHATSFLTEDAKEHFDQRRASPWVFYSDQAESCASLLWERLPGSFRSDNPRYGEMVAWADKIDSASYESVEEAILGDVPALRIRASLALGESGAYCERLVRQMRRATLDEVAQSPEVKERWGQARSKTEAGLERFRKAARVDCEIVVFDVDSAGVIISRYAPYHFFPQARYSLGIVRSEEGARITAMRNPWRELPSAPLGKIFAKFGGGGHERVGAVVLPGVRAKKAKWMLDRLFQEIQEHDPAVAPAPIA